MSSNIFSRSVYFWTMQPSAFRYASFGYAYSALPYRPGLIRFSTVSKEFKEIDKMASRDPSIEVVFLVLSLFRRLRLASRNRASS